MSESKNSSQADTSVAAPAPEWQKRLKWTEDDSRQAEILGTLANTRENVDGRVSD
jgi:hypothetical protein